GVAARVVEDLEARGFFYHLEPYSHRYPHCWRCGTPLLYRVVDEWYISMGRVYDVPRGELTREQVDGSLRYQIMEVVDDITWYPAFGYERELDWLRTMGDWMISKKRYWGLALPIWECPDCGGFEVIGGRDELRERAVEGWDVFEGHTPHRPYVDAVRIRCSSCGSLAERVRDVGNPWLDAGIVPYSTLHYREDRGYWARWFPADFITESFPGQFRNWFYSMLAMSAVMDRGRPFKSIFGYGLVFGEDGRPMHKSWGNAIEFDEAADRMGVDVMRWMFAKARPEENILFGWHAADESRRELLVLWNVAVFLVTYAGVEGWTPTAATAELPAGATALDRWILSRVAGLATEARTELADFDARAATLVIGAFVDDLSQWYLRRSRRRLSRNEDPADRDAAFATLHLALVGAIRVMAPILPFLAEELYQALVAEPLGLGADDADSVHLTDWPEAELASLRDPALETAMATLRRAVELGRTLRSGAGIKVRQPLARLWLALPGGRLADGLAPEDEVALRDLLADELNVREVTLIDDGSDLVERRVKPLLPILGQRGKGGAIPAVMAAARANEVEYLPGGGVRLGGHELAADEAEIQATPRPGTAVADDDGVVVVIDTTITDDLRAEGDARELTRAIQDLRRSAGLALDARIEVTVEVGDGVWARLAPHLPSVARDTLADAIATGTLDGAGPVGELELDGATARIGLRDTAVGAGTGR
ncbi:MAG: class I tRNA ligase family protein, partial [Candidatus Limnocylindrales bacterium]